MSNNSNESASRKCKSRRNFLKATGSSVVLATGLAGCAGSGSGGESGGQSTDSTPTSTPTGTTTGSMGNGLVPIKIGVVGGSYGEAQKKAYIETWNENHDTKVEAVSRPGVSEIVTKMKAAGDPSSMGWSIAHSNYNATYQGVKEGLWHGLTKDDLDNYGNIVRLKPHEASFDPGDKFHHIPLNYGGDGAVYNTDHMDEPSSWNDLLTEKTKGKVSFMSWLPPNIGRNALMNGIDFNNIDKNYDSKIQKVYERLRKENEYVATWFGSGAEMQELVANETAITGVLWYGRTLALRRDNNVPVRYTIPKEGATAWVDTWNIPKGLPEDKLRTAKKWLDWTLRPENAQIKTDFIAYGNVVDIPDPAEAYANNPDLRAWDEGRIKIWNPGLVDKYRKQWKLKFNEITSG